MRAFENDRMVYWPCSRVHPTRPPCQGLINTHFVTYLRSMYLREGYTYKCGTGAVYAQPGGLGHANLGDFFIAILYIFSTPPEEIGI